MGYGLTSHGYFFSALCHWSISQKTIAHEKTSTFESYFGCAVHISGGW